MGVRVLEGDDYACLYDSVSMWAFGPVVDIEETDLHDFVEWLTEEEFEDPRNLTATQLKEAYEQYLEEM